MQRVPSERSFGLSVGLLCGAASVVSWWQGHHVPPIVLAAVAAVLLAGALLAPSALRVPNRLWWRLAQALAWINTRLLLTVFFAVVVTPAGLVMRLLGRNPLRPPRAGTTWSEYSRHRRDLTHYDRSF